ncbi:hypothetical protein F2Q68_00011477, partial [Brassica cretica]
RAAPPPLFKSGCSISGKQGMSASWEWICSYWIPRYRRSDLISLVFSVFQKKHTFAINRSDLLCIMLVFLIFSLCKDVIELQIGVKLQKCDSQRRQYQGPLSVILTSVICREHRRTRAVSVVSSVRNQILRGSGLTYLDIGVFRKQYSLFFLFDTPRDCVAVRGEN